MTLKNLFVLSSLVMSVSFNVFAISEDNYSSEFKIKILPLIDSFKSDYFVGAKNVKIHYATYSTKSDAKKCLVILPGRSEPLEKYAEVVHDLEEKVPGEFAFFLMDHRGQGSSQRMLSKTGDYTKGHSDDFDNYTSDLKNFLAITVDKHSCKQKFLLAHSLGAGIATAFMQENPEVFDRAAFSSPMFKIQTNPYKYGVARTIVLAQMAIGKCDEFAIGQKPFNPKAVFSENKFTTSEARFTMAMNMFNQIVPEAQLGGVTNGWLNEVMKGTRKIRKNYSDVKIPLHVFTAGIENYSETSEMVKFCDQAPYCVRTHLETSKHEVLMDRDVNRNQVLAELVEFFH